MGIEHDKRGEFHEEPLGLTAANLARIEEFIDEHGDVAAAVDRKLREALASAERLEESESGQSGVAAESEPDLSNIRGPKPNSGDARQRASAVLTRAQLDEVLASALRTRELSLVGYLAVTEDVTERRLRKCLRSACEVDDPESTLSEANRRTVRGQLARLMLTDDPGLLPAVEEYLDLRRYNEIIHSTIGRPDRVGKIGGKAVGLVLASTIVENTPGVDKQFLPFAVPKSYFLTTDVFSETLRLSHLSSDYSGRKHQPAEELRKMYPATQETFQQLQFSEYTLRKLGKFLESVGNWPIIVRSSSLLEDSTGASFSGKYSSISLVNQGSIENCLSELLEAIGEVYASVWSPEAIEYRRDRNLLSADERMGILLQELVGEWYGPYFLPLCSGTAYSHYEAPWSERIDPKAGVLRLGMGFGDVAVDRQAVGGLRMVPLSHPTFRPEIAPSEIMRASQKTIVVLDKRDGLHKAIPLPDLLPHVSNQRQFDLILSHFDLPNMMIRSGAPQNGSQLPIITFDQLLASNQQGGFAGQTRWLLRTLEQALGMPCDIEVASDGKKYYLVQCRSQTVSDHDQLITMPTDIAAENILFESHKMVPVGEVNAVTHLVYVSPTDYLQLSLQDRRRLADAIVQLNVVLGDTNFIQVGPGRWGTRDLDSGVRIQYSGFCKTRLLIEVADRECGFSCDPSFGTHFDNDLRELNIRLLPVYTDRADTRYNRSFFMDSPNILAKLAPTFAALQKALRVIDVPQVTSGKQVRVVMDGKKGLVYLA